MADIQIENLWLSSTISTGIKMNLGSKGLLGFEDEHAKRPPKRQRQRKGNDSDKQPWILIINFIVEKLPSKTKS